MKRMFWPRLPLALLAAGLVITALAWQNGPAPAQHSKTDTIPDGQKKIRDIDDALDELGKSRAEMERSLKNTDWQKMERDIRAALDKIDREKIHADIERSLKEVNMDKVRAEIDRALREVDGDKIKAQVDEAMAKIDWDKIRQETRKIKETDMKKVEEELKNLGPEIERSLSEARESMDKAKKELVGFKSFIDGLEKDGLINKKEPYTIEYKNGNLTINGQKQPEEVVKRYSDFLKGRKDFTIRKDKDDFNIDKD